jgi:tetratricopeptide (TPR) repeat protein
MKEKINQLLQKPFIIPALFALLIFLAYGLLAPWLGFYWDDLPFAWFLKFFGPTDFIEGFRPFRPLLGYIFTVTTSIFGGHPLTWQILGLIIRFILGLQVWSLLRQVFPTRKDSALWIALLFTVYPAYQQQWVALTHVNQELIPLLFLLSSFILTIKILRNKNNPKYFLILAILLQVLGLFSTEYFFGLEILRFCFIAVIFAETIQNRKELIQKSFVVWFPYFIVWIVNAIWTYSYHQSSAYDSYDIDLASTLSPLALINEFITTLSLSGFVSWLNTFNIFSSIDGSATQLIAFAIFVIATVTIFLIIRYQLPITHQESRITSYAFIFIGLITIFAGRLPSWAAGLPLRIEFDYDRFFVSIMLGASLFIIGLAELTLREGRAKIILLSILIGISIAYQFSIANTFRRDWANQQAFFWQMAWRMPALKENTAVLTYELPFQYASDYQLTSSLNWLYAPDLDSRDIPYMLMYLKTRFNVSEIKANNPIEVQYRTVNFSGNTSDSVVIYKEADGCLRVLDPIYNNAETLPDANVYLIPAIELSNPDLILLEATPTLDKTLFGNEPTRSWCYFYTKAEVARQLGDWDEVINLYREAEKNQFTANLPVENLIFIEALAQTGNIDNAIKLTERTIKSQPTLCSALYSVWNRVGNSEANQLLEKECK